MEINTEVGGNINQAVQLQRIRDALTQEPKLSADEFGKDGITILADYFSSMMFLRNKTPFEENTVLYGLGIIDYLQKLVGEKHKLKEETTLFFPGYSGLLLDVFVRKILNKQFNFTPLSIRLPTASELQKSDTLARRFGDDEAMNVPNRPAGDIEKWDKDKISTPHLDHLIKGKKHALIVDSFRDQSSTLKQVLFAIKQANFSTISFIYPVHNPDQFLSGITIDKENIMGKSVTMIKINVLNKTIIDDVARYLGSGGLIKKRAKKAIGQPPLVFEKTDPDYRKEALQIREYLSTLGEITSSIYNNQKKSDQ